MSEPSTAAGACPYCHSPLGGDGSCVVCLLRGALSEEENVDEMPASAPTTVYGDFEVARREDGSLWELGRGAMGVTYRAVDRVLHRSVALKVIQIGAPSAGNNHPSAALRERFLREARAAAALRHTNVAGVFQFGAPPDADLCYCAMELVEGETLEARVRRDGPLAVGTTLEIASQVAAALTAAAARGLVHRDLKPSNLMLEGVAGSTRPEVKVIDFGLAKAAAAMDVNDLTQGGFVGTPTFASPEQLNRQPTDARTDFYSLGVTLWYALTGQVPFNGKSFAELRHHPARTALPVERLKAREVPPAFVALLCAMLAEDPARRPGSARELAATVETCRQACAEHNKASSKGRHRSKSTVLALGGALGLILLGAGVTWWAARSRSDVPTPANSNPAVAPRPVVLDKSVAVLPFDNSSEDKESAFFADGMQDELLTDLAHVADLKVISRSSVMQYKDAKARNLREIGQALGVAYVVEGSVQRAVGRLRVTARLIDTRTDAHRWAEHYDRPQGDVFALQSELAQAIAGQLQAAISPQEHAAMTEVPTRDETAYELYIRARVLADNLQTPELDHKVLDLLRQATARDPAFARAFALAAQTQGQLFRDFEHTPEAAAAARELTETTVRLRPSSRDAAMATGYYHLLVEHDFPRAQEEFAAVTRRSPNDAEAHLYLADTLLRQGHPEEALTPLRRSQELDPVNTGTFFTYVDALRGLHRYGEIEAVLDARLTKYPETGYYLHNAKALAILLGRADTRTAREELANVPTGLDPGGFVTYVRLLCGVMERDCGAMSRDLAACPLPAIFEMPRAQFEGNIARCRGDATGAATAYTTAHQSVEEAVRAQPDNTGLLLNLAWLDASLDHREAALEEGRRALAKLPANDVRARADATVSWAKVLARVGEREEAIAVLRALVGQPWGLEYGRLHLHPEWDNLRGDPRFESLVADLAPRR